MIELTVMGAVSIDYPHETFLLDDGKRPEIAEIAKKYGVHYLTRADNSGAKAGNLNNALRHSKADFVATFDADHIPRRDALDTLAGHMKDPLVGMAQAPQTFYNEDSFLFLDRVVGAGRWHEQAYFFDVLQPSRDCFDGITGVGTGVIYRRSTLDEI
ncbi:MAG: glycosyltransferase, partial [Verrucomicrobiaceae bacterium]|nr:glycosyltransferase [Verrucomicrobiaceae bacterium]